MEIAIQAKRDKEMVKPVVKKQHTVKTKKIIKENLPESEINNLPVFEQRKYKTRQMLQDILKSSQLKRKTISPGQNIGVHSQVAEFMSLDYKSKKNTARGDSFHHQFDKVDAERNSESPEPDDRFKS